jgi:hypothetical protein
VSAARIEHLLVGGDPAAWERLGFRIVDSTIWLHGAGIRFVEGEPRLVGWAVSGLEAHEPGQRFTIEGLHTLAVVPETPVFVDHPVGAIEIDHLVVTTGDLERTSSAIEAVTGAPLRRIREADIVRQGFHRLGNVIVEVVEARAGEPTDAVAFFGLVFNVDDLDRACEDAPDLIGPPKDAVQPGRRIATVGREAGLGTQVALMSMPPRA